MISTLKNPVVTGVAGMAVMGMTLGGVAQAGGDHGHGEKRKHGELIRSENVYSNGDGTKTVTTMMQQGRVAAIDDDSILVRSKDGFDRTYALRQATDFDFCTEDEEVAVGDLVTVYAKAKNGNMVARVVEQRTDKSAPGHQKKNHRHDHGDDDHGHGHDKDGRGSHDKDDHGSHDERR